VLYHVPERVSSTRRSGFELVEQAAGRLDGTAAEAPLSPISDPVSRTDVIVDRIRRAILRGDLQPGQSLVERELASMLGVSKTPIREALRTLAATGLVTVVPFRGTTVRECDSEFVRSIYEVRILLEPEAVRRAVSAQTPERVVEAREILREAGAAGRSEDYASLTLLNRRFHRMLYAPCDNVFLRAVLDGVSDQVALIAIQGWRRRGTWGDEATQHDAILEAVEAGNAKETARRLRRHIDESLKRLLEELPDPQVDGRRG
jgi:DNA-binding GntR family transcriptional regulator